MKSPLIVDRNDPKWLLLEQIISVTTSRRAKQELAKHGIKPVNNAGSILRILILSIFFSVEITYAVEEIRDRRKLKSFIHVEDVPDADEIYRFISRIDEKSFISMINALLRYCSKNSRKRNNKTIIVDGSAITLDINVFKKALLKRIWNKKTTNGAFQIHQDIIPDSN